MSKGFEVRFRDKTVRVAVNESICLTIIAQERYGERSLSVGALMSDTWITHFWLSVDDLKLGDKIIIERKEIEESSEPVYTSPFFGYKAPALTEDQKIKINRDRLDNFHKLENKLKEEGLI